MKSELSSWAAVTPSTWMVFAPKVISAPPPALVIVRLPMLLLPATAARLIFSRPLLAKSWMVSFPQPSSKLKRSVPASPHRPSSWLPPVRMSFPLPPRSVSLPSPPFSRSLPLPPVAHRPLELARL